MGIFTEIPAHNKIDILKKLDFKDFSNFVQCGHETVSFGKHFSYRLNLQISEILFDGDFLVDGQTISSVLEEPIRMKAKKLYVKAKLSEDNLIYLEEICRKMHLTADTLYVSKQKGDNEVATVDQLIKMLKVETLEICHYESCDLRNIPALERLKSIRISLMNLETSDFLSLKTPEIQIYVGHLLFSDVNSFLEEWYKGKRRIIEFSENPTVINHSLIFGNLEFSLLTPANTQSLSFPVPYEELMEIHSLTREDGKKLAVATIKWKRDRCMVAFEFEDMEDIDEWIRTLYTKSFWWPPM